MAVQDQTLLPWRQGIGAIVALKYLQVIAGQKQENFIAWIQDASEEVSNYGGKVQMIF